MYKKLRLIVSFRLVYNLSSYSLSKLLKKTGFSKEKISNIKFPAGLDIGATTPEEIAISVLAEIIKEKYKTVSKEKDTDNSIKNIHEKDPICGMIVDPKTAADSYSIDGKMYYFCCSGCKNKFQTQSSSSLGFPCRCTCRA